MCVCLPLPRASPERLFLQHTVGVAEVGVAEHLAISVGLDITLLAELAAHFLLRGGHVARAIRLYALSKVSTLTFVALDLPGP